MAGELALVAGIDRGVATNGKAKPERGHAGVVRHRHAINREAVHAAGGESLACRRITVARGVLPTQVRVREDAAGRQFETSAQPKRSQHLVGGLVLDGQRGIAATLGKTIGVQAYVGHVEERLDHRLATQFEPI